MITGALRVALISTQISSMTYWQMPMNVLSGVWKMHRGCSASTLTPRQGIARGNARRLGLSKLVTFGCADCAELPASLHQNGIELDQRGFIAINPPYGMRL